MCLVYILENITNVYGGNHVVTCSNTVPFRGIPFFVIQYI